MEISKILAEYNTDKVREHSYGRAYDDLLAGFDREAELDILEIGTHKGESLKAWRECFPFARITGIDIEDKVINKDPSIIYVVQDIKEFKPTNDYDIVIDDGSHFLRDVIHSVDKFVYKLKVGGIMIVEDVQVPETYLNAIADMLTPTIPHNQGYNFKLSYMDLRYTGRQDDFLIIINRQ